jgi:excisionase family DNA binding protein
VSCFAIELQGIAVGVVYNNCEAMSRLSLNDWYRYLESQFVEEERRSREGQATSPDSPADSGVERRALPTEPQNKTLSPTGGEGPDKDALSPIMGEGRGEEANAGGRASGEPTKTPSSLVGEGQSEGHISLEGALEPNRGTDAPPQLASREAYALVSIRIPDFLAFVPLLREELGLPAPKPPSPEEPAPSEVSHPAEPPAARLRKHHPKKTPDPEELIPPEMDEMWAKLPRYLRYLAEWSDDSVTDKYYPVRGRESREELIARLTDPVLTLEEVARLLGVCPATVRRYTNRGWLRHFRTEGNQRRFRLSDVVAFLEAQMHRVPHGGRSERDSPSRRKQA